MRGKKFDGFVTREQLLQDLFSRWTPRCERELVPLPQASGRVTACELVSRNCLPVCRTSGCDGIAVQSERFRGGMPDYRTWREGVECARADTGDDFADCFDAVIMIEEVDFAPDGSISFISEDIQVEPGSNVMRAGSTIQKGQHLLEKNTPIRPTDLAVLAMGGCYMVPVWKKPRVAFLPTGTELIAPQMCPARGQNIDTNSLLVSETLRQLGAEPIVFPITVDNGPLLEQALDDAVACADIVIINGGTARGEEDFNTSLIAAKGELLHHYVSAAPGRPLAIGLIDGKPVINLPGPTIAAFFGLEWCLAPIVCRALNLPAPQHERVNCILTQDISTNEHMAILCRMQVVRTARGLEATPISFKDPGGMPACLTSNAMYVSPVGETCRRAGETIQAELLRGAQFIPCSDGDAGR